MKKILFLFALLGPFVLLNAQNDNVKRTIFDDEDLQKSHYLYYFPAFENGTVVFKNNTQSPAKLNYNIYRKEMQFIQNDTVLSLTPNSDITHIFIHKQIFIPFRDGYACVIWDGPVCLLDFLQLHAEQAKDVGYGITSSTAAVDNVESLYNTGFSTAETRNYYLPSKFKVRSSQSFYLMKDNKTTLANKKGFIKYFPEKKAAIETYLSTQKKFDFKKKNDLMDLLAFIHK